MTHRHAQQLTSYESDPVKLAIKNSPSQRGVVEHVIKIEGGGTLKMKRFKKG